MFDKNLRPHSDEDESSDKLELTLEHMTEFISDIYSEKTENKSNHPYDGNGKKEGDLEEGKVQSDSQRVNTRGNCQNEEGRNMEDAFSGLFALNDEWFVDHLSPNKSQKSEGNPMIIPLDDILERESDSPSDNGHQGLEKPKCQCDQEGVANMELFQGKSTGDRDGKGVHRESYSDKDDGKYVHGKSYWMNKRGHLLQSFLEN